MKSLSLSLLYFLSHFYYVLLSSTLKIKVLNQINMESTDSSTSSQQPQLPPGFRFHPTDEELVVHYLKKKTTSAPLPVAIIAEVDLYKFDPWELPAKAAFGEQEWYFFSPRDRKYPNGARPNRAATSGYWKATGTDKPVLTSGGTEKIGVKKALVFYGGKPPKGIKTNWIMHEYRLADNKVSSKPPIYDMSKKNSLRLDDWVLCRIYKKNNGHRSMMDMHERDESMDDMLANIIPPSITVFGSSHHQHNHPRVGRGGGLLQGGGGHLPNDHNHQNLFVDGLMINPNNEGIINNNNNNNSISNAFPMKRSLPSLFWTDDHESSGGGGQSSDKRALHDPDISTNDQNGNNNSIVTLLSQLPQTSSSSLHQQQSMLAAAGSLGDGIFRQPSFHLPGLNWYP